MALQVFFAVSYRNIGLRNIWGWTDPSLHHYYCLGDFWVEKSARDATIVLALDLCAFVHTRYMGRSCSQFSEERTYR